MIKINYSNSYAGSMVLSNRKRKVNKGNNVVNVNRYGGINKSVLL